MRIVVVQKLTQLQGGTSREVWRLAILKPVRLPTAAGPRVRWTTYRRFLHDWPTEEQARVKAAEHARRNRCEYRAETYAGEDLSDGDMLRMAVDQALTLQHLGIADAD